MPPSRDEIHPGLVTLRAALDELGLDDADGLTRDRLRRTYLRCLRQHPPEKDPDGFARLRAAFELVERYLEVVAAGGEAGPVDGAPADETAIDEAPADAVAPIPDLPPPASLRAHVVELLRLLDAMDVEAARACDRGWRADHAADARDDGDGVAAHYLLVRELIAAADDLPTAVVRPLVVAIGESDVSGACADLNTFRLRDRTYARHADAVLRLRAPTIHAAIAGRLYQPPPPASRQVLRALGKSGGVLSVLAFLLVKLFVAGHDDRSTRFESGPTAEVVRGDPDRAPAPTPDVEPPPARGRRPLPAGVRDRLVREIRFSLHVLANRPEIEDAGDRDVVDELWRDVQERDCDAARPAMVRLEALIHEVKGTYRDTLGGHVAAVRARLEQLCPAPP